MQRVGIVDYRMGNLASVAKALEKVGAGSFVSQDAEALAASDIVVLPGVGNFAAGMANLRRGGLDAFVREWGARMQALRGDAYAALSDDELLDLAARYRASYIVLPARPIRPGLVAVYRAKGFAIYRALRTSG